MKTLTIILIILFVTGALIYMIGTAADLAADKEEHEQDIQ